MSLKKPLEVKRRTSVCFKSKKGASRLQVYYLTYYKQTAKTRIVKLVLIVVSWLLSRFIMSI